MTERVKLEDGAVPHTMILSVQEHGLWVAVELTEAELLALAMKITQTIKPEGKCR